MSKYTLSDFKDRMSEEDYEFLKNEVYKSYNLPFNLILIGSGGEGKTTLIEMLFPNSILVNYGPTISGKYNGDGFCCMYRESAVIYEINNKDDIPAMETKCKIIRMRKPDQNESMMVNY